MSDLRLRLITAPLLKLRLQQGAAGPIGPAGPAGPAGPTGQDGAGLTDGDKGDISVTDTGATWTIDAGAVTYSKIQSVSATARFLGRVTAGAGDIEELTGAQATALLDNFTGTLKGLAPLSGGGTANFLRADGAWDVPPGTGGIPDGDKGDIVVTGSGGTWSIDSGVVTLVKLGNINTDRLIGRDTAATGSPEEISVGGGVEFSGSGGIRTSALIGDVTKAAGGTVTTIANDAVTYAKMQNVSAAARFLGRFTAGAGDAEELTGTQATTLIDAFTDTLKGAAPASGGGTANFLRADGAWDAPPTGTVADGDKGEITVSGGSWTIDNDVVTYAKMQNVSATDRVLGRSTAGAGDVEEIVCTAAGRALLDDASAAVQLATLSAVGYAAQALTAAQQQQARTNVGAALKGYLFGLTLSNNATDTGNDIDIEAGQAASTEANPVLMVLASALTKRLDAAWAVGTNQGGLDTGAVSNTTYHVWLIRRSDTGVVDALFSLSPTAPTMPANYDQKRRVGSFVRIAGSNAQFVQAGDKFKYKNASISDVSATNPGTAAVLRTLTVPTGIWCDALTAVNMAALTSFTAIYLLLTSTDESDRAVSGVDCTLGWSSSVSAQIMSPVQIKVDAASQIRTRLSASAGSDTIVILTQGWVDRRGQAGGI